ncbi:MAG: DUF1315 family protein [Colwellia polaris]|jgi:uncharacterized protein YeaC (DUF1315 family)|uniref:YeaC family protein n=1 Tax=Colwellia polaris TaxID=326537 RepID=UPI000A16CF07|nr:DUF1315 family protein [Colwellia polaris]|tara:strand:+ start:8519 stop:8803 length:285 start_codon:yes stop_codon:yes gene_type:complete
MDIMQLVDTMSEDMYLRLKCAAETGKWPEGTVVAKEQQLSALQITMAYQAKHLNSDQTLSISSEGEMIIKTKRELRSDFPSALDSNDIARFSDI